MCRPCRLASSGRNYKGQISAKFTLTGKFDKDVLTSVGDPTKDLFAAYLLSGHATEVYDSSVDWAPPLSAGCTLTIKGSAGQMRVVEQAGANKSQVQFMFFAGSIQRLFRSPGSNSALIALSIRKNP